jgi:hypothetical protein
MALARSIEMAVAVCIGEERVTKAPLRAAQL